MEVAVPSCCYQLRPLFSHIQWNIIAMQMSHYQAIFQVVA